MKSIKFFGCFTVIAMLCTNLSYSQNRLTLRDALTSAYRNNPAIVKNQYQIESQESTIKTAYGDLFPTLSFNMGVSHTNQISPPGLVFDPVTGTYTTGTENTSNSFMNYSLNFRSDVTLFNGFNNYDRIDAEKQIQLRNRRELEQAKQDVTVQVLSNYISVLRNLQVVKIDSATLEDSRVQLQAVQVYVQVGTKTLDDVYKQQVIVAQNELALEQAKNEVNKSIADLSYNANLPQNVLYTVDTTEFSTNLSNTDLENYVTRNSNPQILVDNALRNRYDYKASLENLEVLKTNLEIARSALIFPTITGFGQYGLQANNIGDLSNSRTFTIGLNLSYPIFEGFSFENQREQALINLRSANVDVKNLSNQITLNIEKALYDLRSLLKQIEITDASLQSAERDRYLAEESYKVGRGTLLEVNTAAINYNNLLITRSNLIYNFIFAQKQLEYYQGLLKY